MDQRINNKYSHKMTFNHPKLLGKDAKLLLISSTLFTLAVALSNTFVNVYLWKISKNYVLIGWFNFFQYLSMLVIFIITGRLAKLIDRVILLRLGVSILAFFYFIVLILGEHSSKQYILLGTILGTGQGFYWFAYNNLYFEITEPENRDIFNGWNGLLTSSGGIIAPFLSGLLISKMGGFTGYRIIFFVSLVVFFIAVIVSFFFYKRKSDGEYQLKKVVREAIGKTSWRDIILAMMAQGGREGVIVFLIGLLIYISTNSEFSLGTYTMIISAVSLVTYYLVGKLIKKNWRNISMMIGSIMMAVVVVPMSIKINYSTMLIYGIGTSIFAPLYFIPFLSTVFDKIGESEATAKLRGEYIVIREIGLNMGRIFITLIFIFFVKKIGVEHIRFLLLFSGSMQILAWYFMRRVNLEIAGKENKDVSRTT